jgi:hypothetical protein
MQVMSKLTSTVCKHSHATLPGDNYWRVNGACLDEDALGVWARHAMHAVECELEVWAAQQVRQAVEVVYAPQQLQVVLHLINDLPQDAPLAHVHCMA